MVFKKKLNVVLLTTKTLHHRYFIKILEENKNNNVLVIYDVKKIKPKVKIGNIDLKKQLNFERKRFFSNDSYRVKSLEYCFNNLESKKCLQVLQKFNPNVGITFGTRKISEKLINIFKGKIINIHRGLMTKYRGLDSEFWACYHRDFKSIATTIHFVNKFLDKGISIYTKKLVLKKGMKAYMLRYFTTLLATKRINKVLREINNAKRPKKKSQVHGRYYSFIPFEIKKIAYENFDKYCSNLK